MSLVKAASTVYATLKQVESDLSAGDLASLQKSVPNHHAALNDLRKVFGVTWAEFTSLIGVTGGVQTESAGGPGKDDTGSSGGN